VSVVIDLESKSGEPHGIDPKEPNDLEQKMPTQCGIRIDCNDSMRANENGGDDSNALLLKGIGVHPHSPCPAINSSILVRENASSAISIKWRSLRNWIAMNEGQD
jgi:hypothetical protein